MPGGQGTLFNSLTRARKEVTSTIILYGYADSYVRVRTRRFKNVLKYGENFRKRYKKYLFVDLKKNNTYFQYRENSRKRYKKNLFVDLKKKNNNLVFEKIF